MHDANGTPLAVGDRVKIDAEVVSLSDPPNEGYCNVTLKSMLGRRPDGLRETISAINTGVLIKATPEEVAESDFTRARLAARPDAPAEH